MIDEIKLQQTFESLNLTSLQGKILIELMRIGGESTAPELHERLGKKNFKRTTIYSSLEKLVNDGFVVESDQDGKQKVYGLKHTTPEQLIKNLTKSHEEASKFFSDLLIKANNESKLNSIINPLAYYSIKGREKLLNQIENVIADSEKYILVQANITMLEEIFSILKAKKDMSPNIKIFILITWNPDPKRNIMDTYNKYVELLAENFVSLPHAFYTELFSLIGKEIADIIPKNSSQIYQIDKTHFIQLLTDEASVLGIHFGSSVGGGHYTRDPYTTQAHYSMFFLIFELSKGTKINREIVKEIMIDRLKKNYSLVFNSKGY
jgi:sugar-specific transcriptional regulator TrmB